MKVFDSRSQKIVDILSLKVSLLSAQQNIDSRKSPYIF